MWIPAIYVLVVRLYTEYGHAELFVRWTTADFWPRNTF